MNLFKSTHIHNHKTEHVPYVKEVKITEHKAPTDESVKLLNEMQEKAKKNIIATIHIEQNYLKAIVIYTQDDVVSGRMKYAIKFNLNGKDCNIEGHIDHF